MDDLLLHGIGLGEAVGGINGIMLYDHGEGGDNWVAGYSVGGGSVSKETDHLYIQAIRNTGMFNNIRTYVLDSPHSFSADDVLLVEWENTVGTDSVVACTSYIGISDNKTGGINEGTAKARQSISSRFPINDAGQGRLNSNISVISGLNISGNNYVKIIAEANASSDNQNTTIKVYRVYVFPSSEFAKLFA